MAPKKVVIIGSGFGGLASACIFAQAGYDVTVLEKNEYFGGRAGLLEVGKNKNDTWQEVNPKKKPAKNPTSFRFDTGPSWYLMPDVFEHFFSLIGEDAGKLLNLVRLDPSYQVVFKDTLLGRIKIHGDLQRDSDIFEQLEPHSTPALHRYLNEATYKYQVAVDNFLYKNYDSVFDFFNRQMITEGLKLNVLSNMQKYVSKFFVSSEIQKILQYSLVFLGSSPDKSPAIYSLLSHVDFKQGVYYPMGGMYELTNVLTDLAKKRGVKLKNRSAAEQILMKEGRASAVRANGKEYPADIVISNADIAFTDEKLVHPGFRAYKPSYWKRKTMAPSALLMYLGVKGTYPTLEHHNLVFSKDWSKNFKQTFGYKKFPSDPSFYVSNPNKTDPGVAPKGHENLFVLVPISADIRYNDEQLEAYADSILQTMEKVLHLDGLRDNIVYKKLYCARDFEADFNSYKGTALGLAHTLRQTAVFRPKNQHPKIPNLLFAGANTTPGIGLPMCLISAELAYKRVIKDTSQKPLSSI